MPIVFTGRWSRGTIIDQALQRVGNVKTKHLLRDRLNRILEELYTQWEWPFLYKVTSVGFPGGNTGGQLSIYASFALPADFLKTETETTGLRITAIDGEPRDIPVVELDPIRFRNSAIPHHAESGQPRIWYPSYAERIGYYWPTNTQSVTGNLIYKFLPADMPIGDGSGSNPATTAYDADIPLFPWGGYLSMECEYWAYQYDHDDQRASMVRRDADATLDMIRNVAMPRQSQDVTLPLDPLVFGPAFRDESSGGGWDGWDD